MDKGKLFLVLATILIMAGSIVSLPLLAQDSTTTTDHSMQASEDTISQARAIKEGQSNFGRYIGAGIAIAGATIGAGAGVGRIGAAAIGAISEKQEMTGMSLVFVALAEGISLWGFLIAFMVLNAK